MENHDNHDSVPATILATLTQSVGCLIAFFTIQEGIALGDGRFFFGGFVFFVISSVLSLIVYNAIKGNSTMLDKLMDTFF